MGNHRCRYVGSAQFLPEDIGIAVVINDVPEGDDSDIWVIKGLPGSSKSDENEL